MASFAAHSALGSGVCAGLSHALGIPPIGPTIYGAVLGGLPDTFDWVMAKLGLSERWYWYVIFHASPPWWLMIQPPFALHLWLDKPFHKIPGENWWPRLWWAELLIWFIAALLLWYAYYP
jgi:hypothetical protein